MKAAAFEMAGRRRAPCLPVNPSRFRRFHAFLTARPKSGRLSVGLAPGLLRNQDRVGVEISPQSGGIWVIVPGLPPCATIGAAARKHGAHPKGDSKYDAGIPVTLRSIMQGTARENSPPWRFCDRPAPLRAAAGVSSGAWYMGKSGTKLRLETVALAANREDVTRHLRVFFELLPQPCNVNVHRARPDKRLVVPDTR